MSEFQFPKRLRLLQSSEFERVFAARNSAGDSTFVLYGAANGFEHPRLGFTVSRKVGGAVERNRWKRLLREAFRMSQHELPAGDFVCVVRGPVPPELAQLSTAIQTLAQRIARKLGRAQEKSK